MRGAVTFETIDHEPPDVSVPIDPPHAMHGWCWCQPRVEIVIQLDGAGGEVIVHRRMMDMEDL